MSNIRRKRRARKRIVRSVIIALIIVTGLSAAVKYKIFNQKEIISNLKENNSISESKYELNKTQEKELDQIAANSDLYPKELVELAKKRPETLQFVLDYPQNKDKVYDINIAEEIKDGEVPLFIQWDERWGYSKYDTDMMAIDGCGPTCLSMVATYVLKVDYMNPRWMADFSEENGYISNGATLWTLMSEGAEKLGMEAIELPLDKERIEKNLSVGNPIICIMGPGDFTTDGHFIVLTGLKDGKITVNDPNSRINSSKTWDFDEIESQIRNLWVYR